jgi:hypothetical protein
MLHITDMDFALIIQQHNYNMIYNNDVYVYAKQESTALRTVIH